MYETEALKRVKVSLDFKATTLSSERGKRQRKARVEGVPSTAKRPTVGPEDEWAVKAGTDEDSN